MIFEKKFFIFSFILLFSSIFFPVKAQTNGYVESDTYYLVLGGGFTSFELQAYEVFPDQVFWARATVKTINSHNENEFDATIGLPQNFTLVNDVFDHPNLPINESTDYEWTTTWNANSSDTFPGSYELNVTENLFNTNKTADITVNPGPTLPFNITVITDKSTYNSGESGNVFLYIFDDNNYPFNIHGSCNSTIFNPDGTPTSFENVSMIYLEQSRGEYVSSSGFLAWSVVGTYTVRANCSYPFGYSSTTFEVTEETTTPTTEATTVEPTGGPGGGPARTTLPLSISNFTVDKESLHVKLIPGGMLKRKLVITNTGNTFLDITVILSNLDLFLSLPEGGSVYTLKIWEGDTKTIEFNFFASKDQEPGVYAGKMIIKGDSVERTVAVVVEVESAKPLFDVKVEVLPEYMVVHPAERIIAQLTLYNLGGPGRVDVNVNYGIKDLSGNLIYSESEAMAIETQISTLKSFNLSETIKPDSYIFYAIVSYNETIGTGSSMFKVIEVEKFQLNLLHILLMIILIIIAFIIAILYYSKKKKKKKKKEEKPKKKKHKKRKVKNKKILK